MDLKVPILHLKATGERTKMMGISFNFVVKQQPMNIEEEKRSIIERIRDIKDEDLLRAIESILNYGLKDEQGAGEKEERSELLKEKLRSRAKASEEDIKAGRTVTLEEVTRRKKDLIRRYYGG